MDSICKFIDNYFERSNKKYDSRGSGALFPRQLLITVERISVERHTVERQARQDPAISNTVKQWFITLQRFV